MKVSRERTWRAQMGFSLLELLVGKAVVAVGGLVAVAAVQQGSVRSLPVALEKMRTLGNASIVYVADNGGLLPLEDASGPDDWANAAKPEAAEVWYNALPKVMKEKSVGELGKTDPAAFYRDAYILTLPGAPYPNGEQRLKRPYFAQGMNSRLQRRLDDGKRPRISLASIQAPANTVLFFERGLPGDRKVSRAQRGFTGSPKANPRNFVGRHRGKGILLFFDGHIELVEFADIVDENGRVRFDGKINWTRDPDDDPN